MSLKTNIRNPETEVQNSEPGKSFARLKIAAVVFTVLGISLFAYFIYSVGVGEILAGIAKIGFGGFLIIQLIYFLRIIARATAWNLSVYEPYSLNLNDTVPAVVIGESLSSLIPLGILVSGTSKAIAVRKRVPIVVGLSSIATENLFYSLITGLFICFGAIAFLRSFELTQTWVFTLDVLIFVIFALILFAVFVIVRQWHFASELCEKLYKRGIGKNFLEHGVLQVRLFENLIYGFYRKYPKRFLPIILCQVVYHLLGILEGWFILSRLSDVIQTFYTAFLLETISRLITIVFKFVPFVIGIDEAGAQFVTETLAVGAALGVTLAIIRKGRILFWTVCGLILIIKRGFSIKEITKINYKSDQKDARERKDAAK